MFVVDFRIVSRYQVMVPTLPVLTFASAIERVTRLPSQISLGPKVSLISEKIDPIF